MGVRITVQSLWPDANASTFVYEFAQSRIVIGRSRSADVQLPHAAVSAMHASIRTQGVGYAIFDESSTNGTRVNEARLVPGRGKTLQSSDVVDLGGYRLSMEVGVPVGQPTSARLTADFARQILAEQLSDPHAVDLDVRIATIQQAEDEPVELLPIPKEPRPDAPPARGSRPSAPRASRPDSEAPPPTRTKLGRGELAVYALAALVVATSVVAMALLMRS